MNTTRLLEPRLPIAGPSQAPAAASLQILSSTVVQGGYCIGCGACAAVEHSPIRMEFDAFGQYQARIPTDVPYGSATAVDEVCPFADGVPNEDEIAAELYPGLPYHRHIGYYRACYAGYVATGEFRAAGSSGGVGKWILYELLRRSLVDAVIQVVERTPDQPGDPLYSYAVITDAAVVKAGSKSVYYPVQMADVLRYVKENPGRYAITGVPCFIKALRLLCRAEPLLGERIKYCVGLICGHLKSTAYAEMLGWQLGVRPEELRSIDFRKKLPGTRANEKGVEARGERDGKEISGVATVKQLFGTDYGQGFFKYNACDFCDDVVAETADIVVGDAWLPQYVQDGSGTSVVVTRNAELEAIVRDAAARGDLKLDELTADEVSQSQAAGLRHRRDGLKYRLHLTDRSDKWRPPKRVAASATNLPAVQRRVQKLRMETARRSHELFLTAKSSGEYRDFEGPMGQLVTKYRQSYYQPTRFQRTAGTLMRWGARVPFARRLKRAMCSWFALVQTPHQSRREPEATR